MRLAQAEEIIASRQTIDAAKRLLMTRKGMSEPVAHRFLQRLKSPTNAASRTAILRGAQTTGAPQGRIVCVCHHVPETTIKNLIKSQSLTTVAAIGAACNAGTNCGSCKGELAELLASFLEPAEFAEVLTSAKSRQTKAFQRFRFRKTPVRISAALSDDSGKAL